MYYSVLCFISVQVYCFLVNSAPEVLILFSQHVLPSLTIESSAFNHTLPHSEPLLAVCIPSSVWLWREGVGVKRLKTKCELWNKIWADSANSLQTSSKFPPYISLFSLLFTPLITWLENYPWNHRVERPPHDNVLSILPVSCANQRVTTPCDS